MKKLNKLIKLNKKINQISQRNFFRIIPQTENGVRYNFGKYASDIEPGFRLCIPIYHKIITRDNRSILEQLPKQ